MPYRAMSLALVFAVLDLVLIMTNHRMIAAAAIALQVAIILVLGYGRSVYNAARDGGDLE